MWVIGSIFYLVPLGAIAIHLLSPQSRRVVRAARERKRAGAAANPLRPAAPAPNRQFPALAIWTDGLAEHCLCRGGPGNRRRLSRPPDGRDEPGRSTAMDLRAGLRRDRSAGAGKYLLPVMPFHVAARVGARLGLARFKWPRWLRSKWIAIALMVLFFWSYEAFALWDHPHAHRVAADRLFCRRLRRGHRVPRRQLLQICLSAGPVQLRCVRCFRPSPSRRAAKHLDRCTTHDCIRRKRSNSAAASCNSICRRRPATWIARSAWIASRPAPTTTSACSPSLRCAICCAIRCARRSANSRRGWISRPSCWWWCWGPSPMQG